MLDKNELIQFLYNIENSKYARLAGLIIEQYLLKELKKSLKARNYSAMQSGWIIQNPNIKAGQENWFKLTTPSTELSQIDIEVVKKFSDPNRDFFVARCSITPQHEKISVNIQISKISKHNQKETYLINATSKMQGILDGYIATIKQQTTSKKLFSDWFLNFSHSEIETLVIQRCFMNSLANCIDIDAIAMKEAESRLTFFEFKRKYATAKIWKIPKTIREKYKYISEKNQTLIPLMNAFHNRLSSTLTYMERGQKLTEELNRLCLSQQIPPQSRARNPIYYSLDWSHYEKLQLYTTKNVEYKFIVWNFDPRGIVNAPQKSEEYETQIMENLLSKNFKRHNSDFRHAALTPEDALGITFTHGRSSGTLNNGVRFQVLFNLENNGGDSRKS
ncbi:hypothetical protein [Pseudomonas sp. NPDC088444]|uniref:hypothetical protein n=1 Tax=Pseudomonas sp. NPDC088444 TaxID=3364456 RepID=UPI00384FBCCF